MRPTPRSGIGFPAIRRSSHLAGFGFDERYCRSRFAEKAVYHQAESDIGWAKQESFCRFVRSVTSFAFVSRVSEHSCSGSARPN